MTNQMNEDNIRVAAYYIWEQAGRPEGQEKECWNKACEQLFSAQNKSNICSKKQCKSGNSSSKMKNIAVASSKTEKAQSSQKAKKALA